MNKTIRTLACAVIVSGLLAGAALAATTCFFKSERADSMLKICFYDCLGDTAAITVKSHQLCPITIKL